MAILKQNGTEGKILRNADGKVMRQNYNFGNVLLNTYSTSNYFLEFQHSVNTYSMLIWLKIADNPISNDAACLSPTLGYTTNGNLYANGGVWCYQDDVGGTYVPTASGLYYISPDIHKVDNYYDAYKTPGRTDPLTFRVTDSIKIGRIVFFDREITADEMKFYYNNRLGNELLRTSGVVADFKFENCEIVTIEDVEYAGFADSMGGLDCYFSSGLPSGTVEEQVDFVNTYLISKW